ncbi:MAG TPA: DUF3025 domain-containing protein [Nannocystaceae bacterium]|nr:DUF3025 domain-containing protein [Nannocystaceae bacterium]
MDPVLTAIGRQWPELAGDTPPSRDALALRLARVCPQWTLAAPDRTERYEDAIAAGRIPTREHSWHDAFNVRAFAEFPRAKAALHARMRPLPVRDGRRTREGDALALLDEAALVFAGDAIALAAFAAARDSLDALDDVMRSRRIAVRCFGHALLEHRALARKPIDAGVVALEVDAPAQIDLALATAIARGRFAAPDFSPTVPWPDPRVDAWLLAGL